MESRMVERLDNSKANAEACVHDMADSRQAAHTRIGLQVFSSQSSEEEQDSSAHARCVGFAWDESKPDSIETKYKGNTLFHISMLDGLWNNNRVGGFPGAPMCACVEQMPVVTAVECVKPVMENDEKLTYVKCDDTSSNDLVDYYGGQLFPGNTEAVQNLKTKIVGEENCPAAVENFLGKNGYGVGTPWWHVSTINWIPLRGKGFLYYPDIGEELFAPEYEASSSKIIRRVCTGCKSTHRDIFYRRVANETALPEGFDLLETLYQKFTEENNQMGTHFGIYSSYDDAASRSNPWEYCNYSESKGFPSECGPTGRQTSQFSSFANAMTYAKSFAYYLEK